VYVSAVTAWEIAIKSALGKLVARATVEEVSANRGPRRHVGGSVLRRRDLTMEGDHHTKISMEKIAISKFKATCLGVLEKVRTTRRPILVTRFGKPVAEIVPPSTPDHTDSWLGSMRDRGRIVGDIVEPVAAESDWEVLDA